MAAVAGISRYVIIFVACAVALFCFVVLCHLLNLGAIQRSWLWTWYIIK